MDLKERIDLLVKRADEIVKDYYTTSGYSMVPPIHRADYLSAKWCRIVTQEERNGKFEDTSVYAFICLQDGETKALGKLNVGDIHKAAGWKAPAKHARGNVFLELFDRCMTPHGIVYLK